MIEGGKKTNFLTYGSLQQLHTARAHYYTILPVHTAETSLKEESKGGYIASYEYPKKSLGKQSHRI